MGERLLGSVEVKLDDIQKKELENDLIQFEAETMRELSDWFDQAAEVASFMRGKHDHFATESTKEEEQDLSIYPSIPYLISRIDRMIQYVRHEEADPVVIPDSKVNFPTMPPDFEQMRMQLAEFFPEDMTDNELCAKVLTARLHRFEDRSNFKDKKDEILEIAAQERVAVVLIGYSVDNEYTKEPAFVEIAQSGDYGYDPKATRIRNGRWCYFIQRGVMRTGVEAKYKVSLKGIDSVSYSNKSKKDTTEEESVPEKSKTVDVWHWFIKNDDSKDVQAEQSEKMESAELNEEQEEIEAMEPVEPNEAGTEDEVTETVSVSKYRNNWQYCAVVGGKVIFNGHSPSPSGMPPMLDFTWRRMPKKLMGISMYDLCKDFNMAMDAALQFALESAYKAQPKTLYKKANVKNHAQILENTPSGFVEVDTDVPLSEAFMYLAGGQPSIALYEAFDRVKSLSDEMSGSQGVQMEDAAKTDLSGDALEGLAQANDQEGSAGRIKDRWFLFLKEVYTEIIENIVAYENEEKTLTIIGQNGIEEMMAINVGALRLEGSDVEATYDVEVASPRNMPKNPVRRGQYLLQVIQTISTLMAADPEAARIWVQMSDIPDKPTMIQYIDNKIKQMEGQQATANPEIQKMQMDLQKSQQEAMLAVQRRAAESTADAYERIVGDLAKTNPELALQYLGQMSAVVTNSFTNAGAQLQPAPQEQPQPTPEESVMMGQQNQAPPQGVAQTSQM